MIKGLTSPFSTKQAVPATHAPPPHCPKQATTSSWSATGLGTRASRPQATISRSASSAEERFWTKSAPRQAAQKVHRPGGRAPANRLPEEALFICPALDIADARRRVPRLSRLWAGECDASLTPAMAYSRQGGVGCPMEGPASAVAPLCGAMAGHAVRSLDDTEVVPPGLASDRYQVRSFWRPGCIGPLRGAESRSRGPIRRPDSSHPPCDSGRTAYAPTAYQPNRLCNVGDLRCAR